MAAAAGVALGCASAEGARADGPRRVGRVEEGKASYYGRGFAGRKTASGERFDPNAMTAAHKSLPFGTRIRVTRAERRVGRRCGSTIAAAARTAGSSTCPRGRRGRLGMIKEGVVAVRFEVIGR